MSSEQKHLLNQEDYLANEKHKILTLNILFSFLSMLFLVAEIICSFLMNNLYPVSIPLFLGLLSIFGFLSSFFILIWSIWQRRKLSGSQEKWGENTDSGFARFLLVSSVFVFFGILALTFVLHLWSARGLDLFVAAYPYEDQQEYITQWSILSYLTTGLSFINMMVLIYIIYTCFICCGSPNTIRIVLYFSGLFQIIFGFMVLDYVKLIFQYGDDSNISQFLDLSLYGILAFFVALSILAIIALYYFNYHRERSEYLTLGTLLVIVLLVLLGIGGTIYRESLTIHDAFTQDCKVYLSDLSYDDISDYGCTPKYLEYGSEYLNCSDAEQVLVWESEIDGAKNSMKNSVGCLNMNCCNIIGDIYEINLLKLESCNILLICAIFLSISSSFFLTNKYSGERTLKRALEYVFIISLVLLFVLGFASLFLFQAQLPEERAIISVDSSKFTKSSPKVNYTMNIQFISSSSCSLIKNYEPSYNLSDIYGALNLTETGVRTIIIVSNADLWYDNNYSFVDIQMFDKEMASLLFPDVDFTQMDLLVFQGNASKMQKFVNEQIYLCPVSVVSPLYIEYFTTTVNLTNNTADNSTLNWTYGTNFESLLQIDSTEQVHKSSNLNNETEYLNNITNLTDLQNNLNSLNFGDLTIMTYSISSETFLSNVSLQIYSGSLTSCSETTNVPLLQFSSNESGSFIAYNLPYGKYTIFGSTNSSKSNCLQVNMNQRSLVQSLFIVESLDVNEIAVLMEWTNSLDLNLFGSFQLSTSENCIVSYFNEECTGLSFKLLNLSETKAQLVTITSLGEYSYLFFVKRELSWSEYQQKLANQSELNDDFLNSQFTLKAYVNELQFPAAMISYTGSINATLSNATLENATHLAYLGYCVEGEKSDLLNYKNEFWVGNETFPKSTSVC